MKIFLYFFDLALSRIIPVTLVALLFFPQGRVFPVFFLLAVYAAIITVSVLLVWTVRERIYQGKHCDCSGKFIINPNGFGSSIAVKFPFPSYHSAYSLLNLYNLAWYLVKGEKGFWHYPGPYAARKANEHWRQEWEIRITKLKTMSAVEILADPNNLRDILFLITPEKNHRPYFYETLGIVGKGSGFELKKNSFESHITDEEYGAEWTQSFKYILVRQDFSVIESTEKKSLVELGITSEDIGIFEVKTTSQSENWASHPSYGYYARFQPL